MERPDQQAFLESIGADAAQGFLYLPPARAPELCVWLNDNLAGVRGKDVKVVTFSSRQGGAASGRPVRRGVS